MTVLEQRWGGETGLSLEFRSVGYGSDNWVRSLLIDCLRVPRSVYEGGAGVVITAAAWPPTRGGQVWTNGKWRNRKTVKGERKGNGWGGWWAMTASARTPTRGGQVSTNGRWQNRRIGKGCRQRSSRGPWGRIKTAPQTHNRQQQPLMLTI